MVKRTTEAKRETLKRILEYIRRQRGASAREIAVKEKLKLRQAYNYLYDLQALDLIVYNEDLGIWQPKESREKMEFKSKADYELALRHSEKLLFSDEETQRFDLIAPHQWPKILAFSEPSDCLISHIKTGYEDLWLLITKYKRLRVEYVKLFGYEEPRVEPEDVIALNPLEPKDLEIAKRLRTEINKLEEEIITRMFAIMFQVEHGTPLRGECDACPTKYVTIRE